MINIPPTPARIFRKRKPTPSKAPPAVLNLTAASAAISDDSASVTLQFDRAIDVSAMDVTAIEVGTISTSELYQGDGLPVVVDAKTVRVNLVVIDVYEASNVMLFADADNGIKAIDDGGTWSGTGGTGLPFP